MRLAAGLAFLTVLLMTRIASADNPSIVLLQADDAAPAEARTIEAIRAQVGDLPVDISVERHPAFADLRSRLRYATELASHTRARGVFWVDADASADTLLFLFEPSTGKVLLRRIAHEGDAEAVMEEVANVAHSIIEALVEGRHVGMTTLPEPKRPPVVVHQPVAVVRPSRVVPFAILGDVGFVTESLAIRSTWAYGAAASIGGRFPSGVLLRARYGFLLPSTILAQGVELRLAPHPIDLLVGWQGRLTRWAFEAEAGPRLESTTRSATATGSDVTPAPTHVDWALAVGGDVGAAFRAVPWLALYVRVGVEIFITRTEYTVGSETVFTPDIARLRIEGGVSFPTN